MARKIGKFESGDRVVASAAARRRQPGLPQQPGVIVEVRNRGPVRMVLVQWFLVTALLEASDIRHYGRKKS